MRLSRFPLFLLLCAVASLTACEISDPLEDFELRFNVEDTAIGFGAQGVTAQVTPDQPTIESQDIDNSVSEDIKSIDSIENIKLAPEMFSFTASASSKNSAPSGTIRGYIMIGPVPIPGTPITITITDGAVTGVSPQTLLGVDGTINASAYDGFINALAPGARPALADYASLTVDEIRTIISSELSKSRFPLRLGLEVTSSDPNDPLTGAITIREITFSGQVTAK